MMKEARKKKNRSLAGLDETKKEEGDSTTES